MRNLILKSQIHVIKTDNAKPSSCPLIINGINPQQQIDLFTGHFTNFTLIDNDSCGGPVPATGEFSSLVTTYVATKIAICSRFIIMIHAYGSGAQ